MCVCVCGPNASPFWDTTPQPLCLCLPSDCCPCFVSWTSPHPQTVLAATGEHEAGDAAQTITSDPELLCVQADADAVTCRKQHIAADGSGGEHM
eukprot:SAG22_NODE_1789_length_3570_cov_1.742437_3_plen_94_part_00